MEENKSIRKSSKWKQLEFDFIKPKRKLKIQLPKPVYSVTLKSIKK
jgi:hypothetical protein